MFLGAQIKVQFWWNPKFCGDSCNCKFNKKCI